MRSFLLVIAGLALSLGGCNKKCRNLSSDVSGAIVKAYDFGECLVYAYVDSNRVISSDTAFSSYKKKYLKGCDTGKLEAIDFSQHMLVGYKTRVFACNVGFHRQLLIDDAAKTYTYLIKKELCRGCNTELVSPNWVVMPLLKPGYKLLFKTEEQ